MTALSSERVLAKADLFDPVWGLSAPPRPRGRGQAVPRKLSLNQVGEETLSWSYPEPGTKSIMP